MNDRKNLKAMRWKQRFVNFSKAYSMLNKAVQLNERSEIERGGLIQFFEVAFELSWKMMKDFLEAEGFNLISPRETIKQAFQSGLIEDGHLWLRALEDRNLTTHTYDENMSLKVEKDIIESYFPLLSELRAKFSEKH